MFGDMFHVGFATDGVLSPDGSLGAIVARWALEMPYEMYVRRTGCPVDTTLNLGREA